MAYGCEHRYFSPNICLFVFITSLVQVQLSHKLGRDTLKTITANENYELGYRTSKLETQRTYFYSASSSLGLIRLAREELKIYNAAVKISLNLQARNETRFAKQIHEYVEDYEETSGVLMNDATSAQKEDKASKAAGDLIGAYRMIRRFRNYIQRGLCDALTGLASRYSNDSEGVKTLKPLGGKGPFKRDMHLTMFAIIFTQLQYGWSPYNVSTATVKGMELGTTLQAVHCIELGVHAVASSIYSVGIDWLELAVIKIQNGDQSADLNLAVDLLEKAKAKHDELWHPLLFWSLNATFFTKRLNDTSEIESRQWQRSIVVDTLDKEQMEIVEDRSWDICSGQLEQTEKTKSELFCWHETMVHPSWKLEPLKVELLAKSPFQVVQFHNVLGSGITQQILTSCNAVLQTGQLSDSKYLNPKVRLCEVCFVSGQQLDSLTQRITGLVRRGEKITPVSIYPPGGHTRLHIDKAGTDYSKRRIATMVYFLEGPEIGGELVFPNARVAAKPLTGSAVLWFNVFNTLDINFATTHASCSLVKGQKKIAIYWIPYGLQAGFTCNNNSDANIWNYLSNGNSL